MVALRASCGSKAAVAALWLHPGASGCHLGGTSRHAAGSAIAGRADRTLHGHRPQAGCHPFRTFELAGNVATLLAAKWLELSEGFLMMDHPLEGFGRAAAAVPSPLSANVSSATACWRANSLRRSSSAVSIFWPIHSSIDGLIISRTRPSIVISAYST